MHKCSNKLCPYQLTPNLKQSKKENKTNPEEKSKEEPQNKVIEVFVNDSKKIQTVRMDCGFDNSSEKCNKCDFKTFSFGLLREHQVKSHQSKNSKTKVIEGFEIDDKTYRELLIAMYEEEEILTFKCRMCNAKTNSKGTLRMHENEVHFKK